MVEPTFIEPGSSLGQPKPRNYERVVTDVRIRVDKHAERLGR